MPVPRPPLKWAGGKRWLVPHLQPLWEVHRTRYPKARLVEPFCGGLAVTLGLLPDRALLNDINPHLISFYRWIQQGLVIDLKMENDSATYYAYRDRFNALLKAGKGNSKEAVALFYYLNHTGYNGLCRFNSGGAFNVPFGRYKHISYQADFSAYRSLFQRWTFSSGDFEALRIQESDFIYADPPYDVPFRQYAADGFSWEDQLRLAHWLAALPNTVVASNQATERIVSLYDSLGFTLYFLDAPRMISCTGDRTKAKEMLAIKVAQDD
ncbi:MAG: Dam family site-specific DNA-(adenine-N6)-methyltransferase [Firmicutes bacterium]|nr:Dam family site-specific DNA-(adenine-N6)-methyltransferase [Bacillota bacterium]